MRWYQTFTCASASGWASKTGGMGWTFVTENNCKSERKEGESESKSYPSCSDSSTHSHAMLPLPAVLLVCAEISPSLLALVVKAGHAAPEGSLAPLQIQWRVFLSPAFTCTSSYKASLPQFFFLSLLRSLDFCLFLCVSIYVWYCLLTQQTGIYSYWQPLNVQCHAGGGDT